MLKNNSKFTRFSSFIYIIKILFAKLDRQNLKKALQKKRFCVTMIGV